ncbi:PEP-CTERM sorting domain-containing protein [Methylobacillus glycogenes]|mgnify:CR=1 FL=1|uniref:PEP-CTERM sorting domain-containing protein n=1 Tax=Methylobacillus glycogenes TaxID=406 RepID=UPI00046F787D|nr:PEP-CTERM sorting domain-containing protein [Methylobacillus glycogenes]
MIKKTAIAMALLAAVAGSASAHATSNDNYGTLLSGSFTPSANFATLSYSNTGNVYYFTLTANDLNSLFTNKAFIGAIAVDSPASVTISNVSGGAPVSFNPGGGPGGDFDYRFVLFQGQNRLTAGESVSWTATFNSAPSISSTSFALHVQGLTDAQGGSAWYTVSAVPEADTYALLGLGLGVVAWASRRKTFN